MGKKWYNYFVVSTAPDAAADGAPDAGGTAPPRAADLVAEAGADAAIAEAPQPTGTPADLSALYESARIPTPAHGYTVLKVAEMLRSEHIRSLPSDVKQKSILVALDAAGVKVSDIVEDAVRRDRALDTYERVLQKHLEDLKAQKDQENARLEQQIAANRAAIQAEQQELDAWRARKHQEENRIAEAVGYFVSPNPVTVDTVPGKSK